MDIEKNYNELFIQPKNNSPYCSTECFICFEHCIIQTPCNCNLYAHPKCIQKFCEASGQQTCGVCLSEYKIPNPKRNILKYFVCFLGFIFAYIILGVLGQLIECWFTEKTFVMQPLWSLEHFIPAIILLGFVIIPCLFFIKRIRTI